MPWPPSDAGARFKRRNGYNVGLQVLVVGQFLLHLLLEISFIALA